MAGIYDTCAQCGAPMVHLPGRGKARKYCGDACQKVANEAMASARVFAPCSVDGCGAKATRVGHGMCEKHYIRQYRNGTTDYIGGAIPGNLIHTGGYVLAPAPGHPRALGGYRAYEHRVVFYDAHGEGPFNCHWCGCIVTWDGMHVDHVDAGRDHNAPDNLVASCPPCNKHRGHEAIRQTMRARYGLTINGKTMTLNEWSAHAGISRSSIVARIKSGWDIERAVFEPRGKFGPKRSLSL